MAEEITAELIDDGRPDDEEAGDEVFYRQFRVETRDVVGIIFLRVTDPLPKRIILERSDQCQKKKN